MSERGKEGEPETSNYSLVKKPPATAKLSPVIYEASSEHKKDTIPPNSSGFPMRPSGSCEAKSLVKDSGMVPEKRVSMIPGQTTLARIPSGPHWAATALARPNRAVLETE